MLHITNGDAVANTLKQLDLPGDILVWREMLTDGPLSADLLERDFLQQRAAYFERTMNIPASMFADGVQEQLGVLQNFRAHEEVILWFEYDLFDQTILTFLLDWFSRQDLGSTRLSLICIGEFPGVEDFRGLGQLTPAQLATLVGSEQEVTPQQIELASRAWQAYVSDDPTAVERLLGEDTSALPLLREALLCHLRRFPSTENGLSRVEQQVLTLLEAGTMPLISLFDLVSKRESVYGFGDLQFWSYLERLRKAEHPPITITGPDLPHFDTAYPIDFGQWQVSLTDAGRDVLSGQCDWLDDRVVERWIGGYHLTGASPVWRWDEGQRTLLLA